MDAHHLIALRQAASALISTAAAPTVLAALRTLLADPAFTLEAPALPQPRASKVPVQRSAREKPAKPPAAVDPDPAWDELRRDVRQSMASRGLGFAELGQTIGRSGTAVRIDLTSRRPPRPLIQTKLRAWLEQGAPEVAPSGTTFRPNGANGVHVSADLGLAAAD